MAHRVFRSDGTFQDIVYGGTEDERQAALARLRATDD
ncbi:hypothetical protein RA8P2_00131 (plasmid) [Variovorax sp. RA8]|nr:hypothetical protein RA8P2_00131 [Variovorax sp. RA8]